MEISVRELKANLAAVLRQVSEGQTATITSHEKPIARLLPPLSLPSSDSDSDDIERLLAAGVMSQRPAPGRLSPRRIHPLPAGLGLLSDAVIEDRS